MTVIRQKVYSELPSGDPTLLNRIAWARRWSERDTSVQYAQEARKKAVDGSGKRSRTEHGHALRTLGWQAKWRGEMDEALNYCLRAESFLPESMFKEARASIYSTLGTIHYSRGRLDLATCAVDRGLWLMRDIPDGQSVHTMTDLMLIRATIQRFAGEKARAGITLTRARELASEEAMPAVDQCTARWLLADGDADKALDHATRAVEASLELGNRIILPYAYAASGACHSFAGKYASARTEFAAARKAAEEDEDIRAQCQLKRELAKVEMAEGHVEEAQRLLRDSAKTAKQKNYVLWRKKIALDLAHNFEAMEDFKAAVQQHNLAWRLQDEMRLR